MNKPTPNNFIVLEGIDGCGKTTQLQALREWLPFSGLLPPSARLIVTREPGATRLGHELRRLVLHPVEGHAPTPLAEMLLYAADRAQHVAEVIRPALDRGDWVLCDRFTGSTVAYQGYGRGLDPEAIYALEAIATGGLVPDLTIWLDVPLAESCRRRDGQLADRIEGEGDEFLARVEDGFLELCVQRDWVRVDADQSMAAVTKACREAITTFIKFQPCVGPA